jgi:hypothetical protein
VLHIVMLVHYDDAAVMPVVAVIPVAAVPAVSEGGCGYSECGG